MNKYGTSWISVCVLSALAAAASDNRLWKAVDDGNGYSYLECKAYPGEHIHCVSTTSFTLDTDTSNNSKWKFDDAGDGYVYIWNQYYWTSWRLTSQDGSTIRMSSGTPADDKAQWLLQDAGDGWYTIVNKHYNKYLNNSDGATGFTLEDAGVQVDPPAGVENVAAVGTHAQVNLNWAAPLEDGGSPVLNYVIYRGPDAGNLAQIDLTANDVFSYADTTVANNTDYVYAVSAVNAAGEGPGSEVSVYAVWNEFDLNKDGIVDIEDLAIFFADWLWQAPWHQS